ncbi:hypothetical protein ACTXT7_010582 [Hymenolepis weldensis]
MALGLIFHFYFCFSTPSPYKSSFLCQRYLILKSTSATKFLRPVLLTTSDIYHKLSCGGKQSTIYCYLKDMLLQAPAEPESLNNPMCPQTPLQNITCLQMFEYGIY